jgi:hypothetical protein
MVVPFVVAGLALAPPAEHAFRVQEVVIFPIGFVPNAWGLWNMLYVRVRRSREVPAGPYGAALLIVLMPLAYGIQAALGKMLWTPATIAVGFPLAVVAYYLAWKLGVARFNELLGVG